MSGRGDSHRYTENQAAGDLSSKECEVAASLADSVFRRRPRKYGCCQSVLYSQAEAIEDRRFLLRGELQGMGAEELYAYGAKV
ncbi:hypothetical protein KIPB_001578 [Kipferlia bialata]|uniref:Uncharacterized protein n=1 Tax=Kipferlia bialata TaxID=797122 RepID=A0A391NIT6_9EUKA|nr:hypothetical protein KIPB_001578 [Kipferlia bialata]|eukprot:g1578.t1